MRGTVQFNNCLSLSALDGTMAAMHCDLLFFFRPQLLAK